MPGGRGWKEGYFAAPANAGPKNNKGRLWRKSPATVKNNNRRGVWVPAFAGTTFGVMTRLKTIVSRTRRSATWGAPQSRDPLTRRAMDPRSAGHHAATAARCAASGAHHYTAVTIRSPRSL